MLCTCLCVGEIFVHIRVLFVLICLLTRKNRPSNRQSGIKATEKLMRTETNVLLIQMSFGSAITWHTGQKNINRSHIKHAHTHANSSQNTNHPVHWSPSYSSTLLYRAKGIYEKKGSLKRRDTKESFMFICETGHIRCQKVSVMRWNGIQIAHEHTI